MSDQPGQPLSVTLPYMSWRMLLDILAEEPHRRVAVLIGSIDHQLGYQLSRGAQLQQRRANGAEERPEAN